MRAKRGVASGHACGESATVEMCGREAHFEIALVEVIEIERREIAVSPYLHTADVSRCRGGARVGEAARMRGMRRDA